MLQHHAQYYSSHKIHELQERALKSPTPKTSSASASPSAPSGNGAQQGGQVAGPPTTQAGGGSAATPGGKQTPGEGKESRSPPPQRHVHTHHHTHVGLGYPMYPAPYGGRFEVFVLFYSFMRLVVVVAVLLTCGESLEINGNSVFCLILIFLLLHTSYLDLTLQVS